MKYLYIYILLFAVTCQVLKGQEKHLFQDGRVKDLITGQPLNGANIKAVKSEVYTKSDTNGKFSIRVLERDILIVSNVGYKSDTLKVATGGAVLISLMPIQNVIDEVLVNSGYQQVSSKEVTGSVQVLSRNDLEKQTGTNILDRLNNVASGVLFKTSVSSNPRQKLNLSVRGLSTINGMLDPLVVLDGFIYEGNINNIDPNSIESISILKDAAASAIWGARAGNGVIVLTSKNGSSIQKKLSVSFEHSSNFQVKSDWNSIYQVPNDDYFFAEKMLFDKGYYDNRILRTPEVPLTPVLEVLLARRNMSISPQDSARSIQYILNQNGISNYSKLFQSNPYTGQNFLNISGREEKMSYNMGIGYTDNKTELSQDDNRLNLYFSNHFKPIKSLSIGLNIQFNRQLSQSGKPSLDQLRFGGKSIPYLYFENSQGEAIPIEMKYRREFIDHYQNDKLLDWNYYPLEDYKFSKTNVRVNDLFASARADYQLFPFLNFQLGFQYQKENQRSETNHSKESYYARNMINAFSEIDSKTGAINYRVPMGGVNIQNWSERNSYTIRGQVTFSKKFGRNYINSIIGTEMRESLNQGNGQTLYGYSEDPLRSSAVDYITRFVTLPKNTRSVILGNPSPSKTINRFVSTYANFAYLLDEKYGFTTSMRKDGANIFGAHTNDKWKPFWSAGLSWNLARENFLKNSSFSSLKVRSTFGYSGNVDLSKTPLPIAENTSGRFTDFPALVISYLNDPSLRWEKVKTLNFGGDFSLKNGSISGSLDYFVKTGVDLYGLSLYDYTVWGKSGTITSNTASMKGNGFEANLLLDPFMGRKVRWTSNILFNYNKNKTTEYYHSGSVGVTSFLGDGSSITPLVGRPLNSIAAFAWRGLDELGNPLGVLNGQPSNEYVKIREQANEKGEDSRSIRFIGSSVPQIYGAVINSLYFKDFVLSANISYKADYYFKNPVTSYSQFFTTGLAFKDFDDRWKEQGDEHQTNVPSMSYPANENRDSFYANSEINVHRGDHIRLEYINLLWEPKFIKNFRSLEGNIFLNIKNLGVLWSANKINVDPDYAGRFSPMRTITLGTRIKF